MQHAALLVLEGPPGPAPDRGVLDSLLRLDRGLRVGWSEYYLDLTTSPPKPLITNRGKAIPWPRWHCFLRKGGVLHHLFIWQTAEGQGFRPLSQALVDKLLTDVGRKHTGEEIASMIEDGALRERARLKAKFVELRQEEFKENATQIRRVLDDPAALQAPAQKRDMKIVSYEGQSVRRTVNDALPTTPEERGWVRPDYEKEIV
jgi:hypothetical protein